MCSIVEFQELPFYLYLAIKKKKRQHGKEVKAAYGKGGYLHLRGCIQLHADMVGGRVIIAVLHVILSGGEPKLNMQCLLLNG